MLARVALRRLVGKSGERDRRPTQDGLDRVITYHDNNPKPTIPVGRIVKFAVATAMRQDEICSLLWRDVDLKSCLTNVRNRKDPRGKSGNDQMVPLLDATGYVSVNPCGVLCAAGPDAELSSGAASGPVAAMLLAKSTGVA